VYAGKWEGFSWRRKEFERKGLDYEAKKGARIHRKKVMNGMFLVFTLSIYTSFFDCFSRENS
jgi:hypothetical protein